MEPSLHNPALSLVSRFNRWLQESIMVKLFSIGFLVLLLLIPSAWIEGLIEERQDRAESVIREIADKWSDSQTLSGPVLVIPCTYLVKSTTKENTVEYTEHAGQMFMLPEQLTVNGTVDPETRSRGIYESVVYTTDVSFQATFNKPAFEQLRYEGLRIQWENTRMVMGITDLGGIQGSPEVQGTDTQPTLEPSADIGFSIPKSSASQQELRGHYTSDSRELSSAGIVMNLHWKDESSFREAMNIQVKLRGSDGLRFVPTGKNTTVILSGDWPDPSFDGKFLPETPHVSDSSFQAKWNVSHFNRPFAQQWYSWGESLTDSEFGMRLLVPVEQYQKTMRSSKYAALIIILTFVALLLVEITKKIRIHPFQYILIGVALTIYYTLLLSISEQAGFNIAYAIASAATVILVAAYSFTFLKNTPQVILLSLLLCAFYGFIFVIIAQQDLSLLIGSIGLFLIVAAIMYFSRNIKWYQDA